jgi:Ca2+-binding EF-hand superfamily protein
MQINQSLTASGLFNSQSQKPRASLDGSDPNALPFHAQTIAEMESRKEQAQPEAVTFRSTSLPSIDTIMEYWGTANAIADLNTDGIVDSADLGIVLSSMPPAEDGGTGGEGGTASDPTVDTITSNWGTSNPDADLNGDGTVDSADLGIVLSGMPPADDGGTGGDGGTASDPTVDTILSSWGTSNVEADLNGDGTVDSADLGIVLSGMPPADEGGTAGDGGGADDEESATAQRMQSVTAAYKALEEALQSGSPGQMIERLANVIFKTLDQNHDGQLVPGDLPLQPKMFAKFDTDENQQLSRDELMAGLRVEFNTYNAVTGEADYGAFAKRWLAAFQGQLPEPTYDNRQAVLASRFGLTGSADAIAAQSPSFLSVRA